MTYTKKITNENETKYYYIDGENQIEITEAIYRTLESTNRSMRHQKRMAWKHGVISLDAYVGEEEIISDDLRNTSDPMEILIDQMVMREAISRLDKREQFCIYLNFWLHYSIKEIAAITNCSAKTVKRIIKSALLKLRQDLNGKCIGGIEQ